MPRKRENTYGRSTRLAGIISGVTFVTQPSGVTFSKNSTEIVSGTISGTTFVTRPSGVTIDKNRLTSNSGPILPFASQTLGQKITTGVINIAGASVAVKPADLGLTTLNHFSITLLAGGATVASASSAIPVVRFPKAPPLGLSGATQLHIFFFGGNGAAISSGISVSYMAIGS